MPLLPDRQRRSWVQHVMGMPISVLVRGAGARGPDAQQAVAQVFAELRHLDAVFSTYRAESEISRLVRGELRIDACSPDVCEVLRLCEQARAFTDGWFDHELPIADGSRRLDPTGLVKGWAVERAARALDALAGHDWLVNAGGDVVVSGRAAPFGIGIQSPTDPTEVLDVVEVAVGGVATSGAYARGGHVLDPRTGAPAAGLRSVTVLGPTLMLPDVLATAAFAEGPASLHRLERTPGHEALLVLPDGSTVATSGWPGRRRGRRCA